MTKVAIAILNWNGRKYLEKFLPGVIRYSTLPGVGIFIIDNGSTDDSIHYISENYKDIKVIPLDKNYGFSAGYNKGLQQINSDYYIIINSDVEVTENWILPLLNILESDKNIAACQPKILSYVDKTSFEYAGAAGGYIDKFGYPFCQGRIFSLNEKDTGQYNEIKSIFWATGACLMIKADIFHAVGGFDDGFFAHMEEIDLCWRIKNMGFKIYYIPESTVYHLGGGTLPKTNPHKTFLNFRNNYFLLFKNLKAIRFVALYLLRLWFDFAAFLLFLSELKFLDAIAIPKAHFWFLISIKKLINKKHQFKLLIKNTIHKEIYNGSIVIDFYIRKRRKFSDINF